MDGCCTASRRREQAPRLGRAGYPRSANSASRADGDHSTLLQQRDRAVLAGMVHGIAQPIAALAARDGTCDNAPNGFSMHFRSFCLHPGPRQDAAERSRERPCGLLRSRLIGIRAELHDDPPRRRRFSGGGAGGCGRHGGPSRCGRRLVRAGTLVRGDWRSQRVCPAAGAEPWEGRRSAGCRYLRRTRHGGVIVERSRWCRRHFQHAVIDQQRLGRPERHRVQSRCRGDLGGFPEERAHQEAYPDAGERRGEQQGSDWRAPDGACDRRRSRAIDLVGGGEAHDPRTMLIVDVLRTDDKTSRSQLRLQRRHQQSVTRYRLNVREPYASPVESF